MCEYCHSSPHLPGCPDEEPAQVVGRCPICHAKIHEGDTVYEFDGKYYCHDCVEERRTCAELYEL